VGPNADDDLIESVLQSIAQLSMTAILRLQERLSRELRNRFEKDLALAFSDVVGSTRYFERFGDEDGRKLQQRHFDLLAATVVPVGGRIVDTAGDGAFMVFPTADVAAGALVELQKELSRQNAGFAREHQLVLRLGFHFGSALTDGNHVTGESVNLASRVAGSGAPGEIRMTKDAFRALGSVIHRLASRSVGEVALKGISRPVEMLTLGWRDRDLFPECVRVKETGEEIDLPSKDTIAFGRLGMNEGYEANDVVLSLPDETLTRKISRWHFEVRRHPEGMSLRQVSDQMTEVDGAAIAKGADAAIRAGTVVRAGRAITLEFFSRPTPETFATSESA
jgi:class 3 adenylate cyclase